MSPAPYNNFKYVVINLLYRLGNDKRLLKIKPSRFYWNQYI